MSFIVLVTYSWPFIFHRCACHIFLAICLLPFHFVLTDFSRDFISCICKRVACTFAAVKKDLPQESLQHLRWMLQKDLLGQDIFLIGRPGPLRRQLAMQYLEMTRRELEYVALSRDTTEADLKQRREIQNGTTKYFDQVHNNLMCNARF